MPIFRPASAKRPPFRGSPLNSLQKWAHRIVYGTDIPFSQHLFSLTYRILESTDEHFYDQDFYFNFNYHWPMYGMGLSDDILKKVYRDTALSAFTQARSAARA